VPAEQDRPPADGLKETTDVAGVAQAEALAVERRYADDDDLVELGGVVAVSVEEDVATEV
jgi:hypothetical protein